MDEYQQQVGLYFYFVRYRLEEEREEREEREEK